jgi:hypothetical protein
MHRSLTELFTKDGQLRTDADEVLKGLQIDSAKAPSDRQKASISKVLTLIDSGVDKAEAIKQVMEGGAIAVKSFPELVKSNDNVDPAILDVAIAGLQQRTQQNLLETIANTMDTLPGAISGSVQQTLCASLQDKAFVDDTNAKIKAMLKDRYGVTC